MMNEVDDGVLVGDQQDAQDAAQLERNDIEHVISLSKSRFESTTEHHPLTDGPNEQTAFDTAVDAVRERLHEAADEPVLVHCAMGQSRAPSVLATALAAIHGERFDEAWNRIRETGRNVWGHPALRDHAKAYLDEPTYDEEAATR